MEWYEAYSVISSGGMVKRANWEVGTYIALAEDLNNDEESCLVNQNGEYITVSLEDLQAGDWVEYDPCYRPFEDYTDKEYYTYVKELCRAKVEYQGKLLSSRFRLLAEKHNNSPLWETKANLKYFIMFSGHEYRVESTWREYYPNTVYFTDKEICKKALNTYRHCFEVVRKLDWQFSLLMVMDYTREELIKIHKMLEEI